MNETDNSRSLIPRPDASLASVTPRPKRVLSDMVTDTLALARREFDASSTKLIPAVTSAEDAASFFQRGLRCQEEGESIQAFEWFSMAAEQGDAEAQYRLGQCYDYGRGVAQKFVEAMRWFRKAAEQGHSKAQGTFATYLYSGRRSELEVLKPDYVEAVRWLRIVAERTRTYSLDLFWLGECYAEGKGTSVDICKAYSFYKLASVAEASGDGSMIEGMCEERLNPLIKRMTPQEIAEGERHFLKLEAKYRVPHRTYR